MNNTIIGAWFLVRTYWYLWAGLLALGILFYMLIKVSLFGDGDIQVRTYNANKPKDRRKLHEIIQGGPDERYVDHGEF